MPRKVKFVPTPSRLSQILEHLRKEPRPQLQKVKALKITYAYRNDHWGARCVLRPRLVRRRVRLTLGGLWCRHFVKDELPRIRYANPRLDIQVNKLPKTRQDNWKPELTVELRASRDVMLLGLLTQ